jgi:hypothetical protein
VSKAARGHVCRGLARTQSEVRIGAKQQGVPRLVKVTRLDLARTRWKTPNDQRGTHGTEPLSGDRAVHWAVLDPENH